MPAPSKIIELVERFDYNLEAYKSGQYNETQVRREFIDPFFKELGWDIDNKDGFAEAYKDVVHEDAIKIGGVTKAPDYSFRIGGARKFFLEAKRPLVNIQKEIHPAFQLRRYAWSARLPLSILTDFEEFAVYDCRVKPVKTDKASTARVKYFTYRDYEKEWDEIASIFSKTAIQKGSFDKYAAAKKRGTAEVDTAFLKEIESWRDMLARNLALRNSGLSQRELNFAVQRTIDRIIFLRICEDRGIEDYGRLQSLLNGTQVYGRLRKYFYEADERYNSGLFHFSKEKGRPEHPDKLTLGLNIDDKPLKEIIKHIYSPDSPYEFSVLPADILGQVYEQFLGKVIRLTKGHQAVVEDKPEVKKAGGVYYTPTYIVDYIVKHTVGKLLESKTPRQVSKLRILDPACGSGSFLIGAYQYLLDWHRDWYVENELEKHIKKGVIYQGFGNEWRLTTKERKRILLNNIYGVDIDTQAVEVTKLSLLLKVLEGESAETLGKQLKMFHERALPDLGSNIKCGNSLIGPDFYDDQQMGMFDEEEMYRVNAFDWHTEFPDIMKKGGFDAVIGNPPYVRQESLGELKRYFQQHYKVYHGVADLYTYFIEKGVNLLKKSGHFGFIISNKWMRANYGKPFRSWLIQKNIRHIIDFGDLPVFKTATTYPCILLVAETPSSSDFPVTTIRTLDFQNLNDCVNQNDFIVNKKTLDNNGWSLVDSKTQKLLEKLSQFSVPLEKYVNGKAYYGIKTGLNRAFVIDKKTRDCLINDDPKSTELIKPFLVGKDIKRYMPTTSKRFLILIPKGWTRKHAQGNQNEWHWLQNNYPAIARHLEQFSEACEKRYDKGEYWWELRTCEYYQEFEKSKIVYMVFQIKPSFVFDNNKTYVNNATWILPRDDKCLLAILNSKLGWFLISQLCTRIQNGYQLIYKYFGRLPIRTIDFSDSADKARHDKMVELVERMLELNKKLAAASTAHEQTLLQRQIESTDNQIDRLVYELYDLTKEEIAIVEES